MLSCVALLRSSFFTNLYHIQFSNHVAFVHERHGSELANIPVCSCIFKRFSWSRFCWSLIYGIEKHCTEFRFPLTNHERTPTSNKHKTPQIIPLRRYEFLQNSQVPTSYVPSWSLKIKQSRRNAFLDSQQNFSGFASRLTKLDNVLRQRLPRLRASSICSANRVICTTKK